MANPCIESAGIFFAARSIDELRSHVPFTTVDLASKLLQ